MPTVGSPSGRRIQDLGPGRQLHGEPALICWRALAPAEPRLVLSERTFETTWGPHEDPRCVSEVSPPLEDKDQYFTPIPQIQFLTT